MSDYALVISESEIRRYQLMADRAQAIEADLWAKAGIVPGAVVADVGCGPAAVTVRMSRVVGPKGRVVGVEPDESALATARALVDQAEAHNVELRHGTATDSGLAAGSVDVAVMRHVLAHNGPTEQHIVDALAALVRPGGHVYLVDVDASAIRMLDADPELADLHVKYLEFHARRGNDTMTGLRLGQLLARAGLTVAAYEGHYSILQPPPGVRPPMWAARDAMLADGVVSSADIARWEASFARMDACAARPTIFAPNFAAIGVKAVDG